jgi:hypothetical protein
VVPQIALETEFYSEERFLTDVEEAPLLAFLPECAIHRSGKVRILVDVAFGVRRVFTNLKIVRQHGS